MYKSNSLIGASYRLSPIEQGIILSCISQIRKDEEVTDQSMYKVSVSDYIKLTGADPKSAYRDIKRAALRLKSREVTIHDLPNGGGRVQTRSQTLVTGWVQSIVYSDKCGEVELRFCHDMIPYLTGLTKKFTKYKLKYVAKMSSCYGFRLYELLIQWANQGKESVEVSLEDLRTVFMIENKYAAIKDFKRRSLEPAIKDINVHSDILVEYEQRKTGRKVTHFRFKFKKKEKAASLKRVKQAKEMVLGLSKTIIEKNAHPGESYEQAAARIKEKMKQEEEVGT